MLSIKSCFATLLATARAAARRRIAAIDDNPDLVNNEAESLEEAVTERLIVEEQADQAIEAVSLLRSVLSDIEALRVKGTDDFQIPDLLDADLGGQATFEWPNLAIMADQIQTFLDRVVPQHVVFAPSEATDSSSGFWSNKDGWGNFETATRFTEAETKTGHLPISAAGDARFMLESELGGPWVFGRRECFVGYAITEAGERFDVEFDAPAYGTKAEKDSAFLDALAQRLSINYLSIGDMQVWHVAYADPTEQKGVGFFRCHAADAVHAVEQCRDAGNLTVVGAVRAEAVGSLVIQTLDDSPTTCPRCGSRTDFKGVATSDSFQYHECLDANCGYAFFADTESEPELAGSGS